jgi:hypothetical protein
MAFARGVFWATVVVTLLALVYVGVTTEDNNGKAPPHDASGWKKPDAWAPGFDEARAVTHCDLAAKAKLMAPDSVDWDWDWRILEYPELNRMTIMRGFSSQNAYGAQLAAHYRCLVDVSGPARILEVSVVTGQM